LTEQEDKKRDAQYVPFFGQNKKDVVITVAMREAWQSGVRSLYQQVVQLYGGDETAAWAAIFSEVRRLHPDIGPDDREWALPLLRGDRNITPAEAQRMLERFRDRTPLLDGLAAALGSRDSKDSAEPVDPDHS